MIILGIDPGTATTGFGVIKKTRYRKGTEINNLKCLGFGCIKTAPGSPTGQRLKQLSYQLNKLIKEYKPDVLAVENVYFFKNIKTALPVSQAKGVILLAAAQRKIPVYEFAPLQVKMAVTGYGRAEKKQVQEMVKILLNLKDVPRPDDAADALAIAICFTIPRKRS